MLGKRVNLTFKEIDYERLQYWAEQEGKTLSTYAADIIRAVLFQQERKRKAAKVTEKLPARDPDTMELPGMQVPKLTRQERRELERKNAKKKK